MNEKRFTPEEANRMLPLIRLELEALQKTKKEFEEKLFEHRQLKTRQLAEHVRVDEERFFILESEMEFLQIQARTQIQSFTLKGIQLKDIDLGLVDFPAVIDGEEVLLCWRQGEERVAHYHGYEDGYAGRRQIEE
ncbi:DUF2203 domain-containing protein [Paenibacillus sp. y28]|uniref:DUF2203 domain-containing protein n=1 Tax=Paenibacillus sp. y28 TaxID=3129110 RepID=UPI00301903BB